MQIPPGSARPSMRLAMLTPSPRMSSSSITMSPRLIPTRYRIRASGGKCSSPGIGGGPHLAELLFMQMTGIEMTHVPYRGAAPAFTDLIPGRVHCYFGSGELLTYSRSGQVRVLALTGATRSPAAPDVPTIAESGVPGYVVDSWQGVFAP